MKFFIKKFILQNIIKLDLSIDEKRITESAIQSKYAPSLKEAILVSIIIIPAALFLDTNVLMTVLIPITMVTGTAWFAISLASMRKKFEAFGLELTASMFKSFVSSIGILGVLSVVSFTSGFYNEFIEFGKENVYIQIVSSVLGALVVIRILWNVFAGSMKYDMNDAMLTGQAEVAERFFRKSLSLLHQSAENLRKGKKLEVANYYIGTAFYEVFSFIKKSVGSNSKINNLLRKSEVIIGNPHIDQKEADNESIKLIEGFLDFCVEGQEAEENIKSIKNELRIIKRSGENQEMVDIRFSVIFDAIAELIDIQGGGLFKK